MKVKFNMQSGKEVVFDFSNYEFKVDNFKDVEDLVYNMQMNDAMISNGKHAINPKYIEMFEEID